MLALYDNPFSPFARKVRMVLRFKGLEFSSIDVLAISEHDRLVSVSPRAEVAVLADGAVTVTDSSDIVAYLEDRFPTPAVFPAAAELRVKARRWQRIADFSLFPHRSALKPLGILLEESEHPKLLRWNREMRLLETVREDLENVKRSAIPVRGTV